MIPIVKLETCTEEELEKYLKNLNKERIVILQEIDDPGITEEDINYTHEMAQLLSEKKEYDQEIHRVIRYLTAFRIKNINYKSRDTDA